MTWIRWECGTPQSDVVGHLSEALRISPAQALGHYTAVCCAFGEHREDGNVDSITDTTLEQWALWRGKPGRFAAIFRARCCDESGYLKGWWRQESLFRKREKDKEAARIARESRESRTTVERPSRVDLGHTNERTNERSSMEEGEAFPPTRNGSSAWTPEQRAAAKGWRKASSDPRAFDAVVKQAAEERLVGGGFGWPVVGQALLEMRGSGNAFNLPYLLGCCRNILARKPAPEDTEQVTDDFGRSVLCRQVDGWWVSVESGERIAEVAA